MHALIIEDEPLIAALIEEFLHELGYTSADLATTEAEAIALAARRCPDLITSDVRLSPGCGITAVQAICSHRPTPVVFVTATGWEVQERITDAMIVPKPFCRADLRRALARVGSPTNG